MTVLAQEVRPFHPAKVPVLEGVVAAAIELVEYFRTHDHRVMPTVCAAWSPAPELSPERRRVLEYHAEHDPVTSQQDAAALGQPVKSVNSAHRALLKRASIISLHWVLTEPLAFVKRNGVSIAPWAVALRIARKVADVQTDAVLRGVRKRERELQEGITPRPDDLLSLRRFNMHPTGDM